MAKQGKTLDQIWPDLEATLSSVLTRLIDGLSVDSWMAHYTTVHNYCTSNPSGAKRSNDTQLGGADMYGRLRDFLKKYIRGLYKVAETRMDDSLLNYYKKEWDRVTTSMGYVAKIFRYLDINWVKKELEYKNPANDVYPIGTLALVLWREHMATPLRRRLTAALLTLIEKERYGEQIDTTLVQGVIQSYVVLGFQTNVATDPQDLSFYRNEFETAFLSATDMYYTAEASQFIATNQVTDYLRKVETRIKEEEKRVRTYLHMETMEPLMKLVDRVLMDRHRDQIWLEFPALLDRDGVADLGRKSDRLDDLTRMYSLLSRVAKGTDPLKDALERHVKNIGTQAIEAAASMAAQDPTHYVTVLLNVHHKYNTLVTEAFKSDVTFIAALDRACRAFINENAVTKSEGPGKSPELIAKYCDLLLKKSPKNPEEQETLEILNGVMLVFKYLEDKDVFQTFYSKMLAKRLIHGTSSSDYLEGQMISKLKQNCGQEYTSKLARMFADIGLSKDIQDRFMATSAGKALTIDFTVLVLATGSWPLASSSTNFSIPRELAPAEASFTTYYQREFSGRKVTWLHHISKGEVKARFPSNMKTGYILQCSTYQMGVLLQFNERDEINAEDLQVATQLNDSALRVTVLSLVKTQVLNMTPEDESAITKNHTFTVNAGFKSRKNRVMVNVPIREAQQRESAETQKYVEEGRRAQVQAAIVRIMKRSKRLSHANLISEVISQVQNRFRPPVAFIKKCIDLLIEKEYLERVDGEKDVYAYKA